MAQVGVQYPNLQQVFGESSMFPTALGMQQFDSAQRSEGINQQQALQDMLFQQQNDPHRLRQAELQNQGLEAGLPGLFANSRVAQQNADFGEATLGDRISGSKSDTKTRLADNEVKQVQSWAEMILGQSQDPAERQVATQVLQHTKDMVQNEQKEKAKQERMLAQIREQNKGRMDVVGAKAASGGGKGDDDPTMSGKLTAERSAVYWANRAYKARAEGDEEEAMRFFEIADDFNKKHHAAKQAAGVQSQSTKIDTGSMGMKTVGAKPVEPYGGSATKAPAQQAPAIPKSESEYRALPSGALYQAPDGSIKRKK